MSKETSSNKDLTMLKFLSRRGRGFLMKCRDGGSTIIIILGMLAIVGYISSRWLGDDNEIEEFAESAIEMQTGANIDLTPGSPERSKK